MGVINIQRMWRVQDLKEGGAKPIVREKSLATRERILEASKFILLILTTNWSIISENICH